MQVVIHHEYNEYCYSFYHLQPVISLTRSLTPKGMLPHSNQEIVFASKNVTTTNININVTEYIQRLLFYNIIANLSRNNFNNYCDFIFCFRS